MERERQWVSMLLSFRLRGYSFSIITNIRVEFAPDQCREPVSQRTSCQQSGLAVHYLIWTRFCVAKSMRIQHQLMMWAKYLQNAWERLISHERKNYKILQKSPIILKYRESEISPASKPLNIKCSVIHQMYLVHANGILIWSQSSIGASGQRFSHLK